jgi:hypothetical protein
MDGKIIVTHRAALLKKYGESGFAKIQTALNGLIAADKARGLNTVVIHIDVAAEMKKVGGKPVDGPKDYRGTKAAIDAVFKRHNPDYLMILGAPDVVVHQNLKNTASSAADQDDAAWGDVPYACEQPYSTDPAQFVGPTRIVGRLPDLTGATNPSHLVALLARAAAWKSRPASRYTPYFGLSADVWKGSTRKSLDNIFGNDSHLLLSPPKGPKHPPATLRRASHFINCHGGPASPEFQGQSGDNYPASLRTSTIAGNISIGTVAAVECCYGAELYDSVTLSLDIPICQSYLKQGAYGYFGSTTIAYGPAEDNGAADLICQYFLLRVHAGASIGRAALMARQEFVTNVGQMDPIDLKTLAQFCLYGDPSIHPVGTPKAAEPKDVAPAAVAERFRRKERRANLKANGDFLKETKATASKRKPVGRLSKQVKSALTNIAKASGLPRKLDFLSFPVKGGAKEPKGAGKTANKPDRYLVAFTQPKKKLKVPVQQGIAVVAKEAGGRIIDYRVYHQR